MYETQMIVPLFDIDWTLVNGANPTHGASFRHMFRELFSLENINVRDIHPHGMTDAQIILEILRVHNLLEEFSPDRLKAATKLMGDYYTENSLTEKITLMPGAVSALTSLRTAGHTIGILSGNVEAVGRQKLVAASISQFFSFGAFGDISTSRNELVDVAEGAMRERGIIAQRSQFIIIGDSIRDVECARVNNLVSIGVATGSFSKEELENAGANFVISSLEEMDSVMERIRGTRSGLRP